MTNSSARSPSTKHQRHRGLALIAAGCCSVLILAYVLPHLLLSSAWIRSHFNVGEASWVWAWPKAEAGMSNVVQSFGRQATLAPNVVFVGIDTPTFDQSDLSSEERRHPALEMIHATRPTEPFPRTLYPYIMERLVGAGAKVVIFDFTFARTTVLDNVLREALDKYREHVVVGSNLQAIPDENGETQAVVEFPAPSLIPEDEVATDDRQGYVNFKPDNIDGVVRRIEYRTTLPEYFGLGDLGAPELLSLTARGLAKAGFGSQVPARHAPVLFRYIKTPRVVSLHNIFVPTLWEKTMASGELFRDKIVFIGPYGNWSKDESATPFGSLVGPLIHLSALNAALTQDFLHQSSQWTDLLFIVLGGIAAVAVSFGIAHPLWRTSALLGLAALFVVIAFLLFNANGLLLNLLGPTTALLSSGFIGLVWERLLEAKEKQRVRDTLERYVSKDVVKEVLDNPESYLHTAGGTRKPITLLFSDIRGFTAMTESADAATLVKQLNEYFSEMVRIVFANRGTLDKFIGDAVMAQWGAFVTRGEGPDACRAVAAALDMLQAMPKLNAGWKARGFPELKIGIGVNHGYAICANIGSDEKQEFTAIGDAVNLASRLEGATKKFHQDLLIGEQVAPLVADHYVLRPVDLIQVQGKSRPVEVFAVLGDRGEMKEPAWLATYVDGIRLFRQRAFHEAQAKFTEVLEATPGDWLAQEYLRRCDEFQVKPPEESWNGSYEMLSK